MQPAHRHYIVATHFYTGSQAPKPTDFLGSGRRVTTCTYMYVQSAPAKSTWIEYSVLESFQFNNCSNVLSFYNNNIIIWFLYSAFLVQLIPFKALRIITLALAPAATGAEVFQGINSCRYPFTTPGSRETMVDTMPRLGAYTLGGIEPPTL